MTNFAIFKGKTKSLEKSVGISENVKHFIFLVIFKAAY